MYNDSKVREAHKAEAESRWWDAYRLWSSMRDEYAHEQAEACKTIAEAVDLGDRYRALVGDAYERWERHEINNSQLHEIQQKAWNEVYGPKP